MQHERSRCEVGRDVVYCFKGINCTTEVTRLATQMLHCRALPGSALGFQCDGGTDYEHLGYLESLGFVSCRQDDGSGSAFWNLTRDGLRSLEPCRTIGSPKPALVDRLLPVADKSSYECLLALQAAGWRWVATKKSADLPPYRIGDEKNFTCGMKLQVCYGRCLLSAASIQDSYRISNDDPDFELAIEHGNKQAHHA